MNFPGSQSPYTQLLLAASSDEAAPKPSAPVEIEAAGTQTKRCSFADRCPMVVPDCRRAEPPARQVAPGHLIACWRQGQAL
ncbi:oligopeptide/dipeptide ABC transporter ATP-binding protein [Mesorhizobium calcicola]|uniref:Oligopeptide/dipeptide ABC transporter ATP-binding protein n=1 Tax=Mesorhizobium calcicola TaxID=1300310 RepID=A0ABW4WS26_9HYPH